MASVKFGGNNKSWELAETLMDYTDVAGQAQTAEAKRALYERMLPAIMGEDVQREKLDTERALREEIQKRKDKLAKEEAKARGTDTGLEPLSEVRPVDGRPGKPFNIANPQQGVQKTGPGGTLVNSKIGSQAFPAEIVQTTERARTGDLGQRGALIRQGPQFEQTTRRIPNVLTAGDVLAGQQRQQALDQNQANQDRQYEFETGPRFDFEKEMRRREVESSEGYNRTRELLALASDERTQIEFDRNNAIALTSLNDQLTYDYGKQIDSGRRTAIVNAYSRNDWQAIHELTRDLPESTTQKLKNTMASLELEKKLAEISGLKAKAFADRAKGMKDAPSQMLLQEMGRNGPDPITAAGLNPNLRKSADDIKSTDTLRSQTASFTNSAFTSGEFETSKRADAELLADEWFARGNVFVIRDEYGADSTDMLNLEDTRNNIVKVIAWLDPDKKIPINKADAMAAIKAIEDSGLAEYKDGDLIATPNNERSYNNVASYARQWYGWKLADQEVNNRQAQLPGTTPIRQRGVDGQSGTPLSASERLQKAEKDARMALGMIAKVRPNGLDVTGQRAMTPEVYEGFRKKLEESKTLIPQLRSEAAKEKIEEVVRFRESEASMKRQRAASVLKRLGEQVP